MTTSEKTVRPRHVECGTKKQMTRKVARATVRRLREEQQGALLCGLISLIAGTCGAFAAQDLGLEHRRQVWFRIIRISLVFMLLIIGMLAVG
jgi:hypothetical protein